VEELHEVSLADVRPEAIKWLWSGKIPLGRVTVVYGEIGIGKTCLALDLAARVSRGSKWGDRSPGPAPGHVLIVNGIDSLGETLSPRLMGGGADPQKVIAVQDITITTTGFRTRSRRFDLGDDLALIRKRLESLPEARLVILDSLETLCGSEGLSKNQMQSTLAELENVAAERGVAIVILSSATKCSLPVKNVWRVDCDMLDEGLRHWVPVRCHWGALPGGLAFRITGEKLEWVEQLDAPTADRSRGATSRQQKSVQLQEQAAWLKKYLSEGPRPAKKVLAAATAAGWSTGQMQRAREALRVVCVKEKVAQGKWMWELPYSPVRAGIGPTHTFGTPCDNDKKALAWLDRACGRKAESTPPQETGKEVEEIKEIEEFKDGKQIEDFKDAKMPGTANEDSREDRPKPRTR